jgi:WD40 repeat protein
MEQEHDFFTPEQVDGQIESLTGKLDRPLQQRISAEQQVVEHLLLFYGSDTPYEDARSLERAWEHIVHGGQAATSHVSRRRQGRKTPGSPLESRVSMKDAVPGSRQKSTLRQRLAMLAAIAVVALLIGSMAIVFSMVSNSHNRSTTLGSSGTTPKATVTAQSATPGKPSANLGRLVYSYQTPFDVYSLAWSPDNQRIAAANNDRAHTFAPTGGHVVDYSVVDNSNNSYAPAYGVAWSPDGKRLAVSSDKVRIFDAASGHLLLTYAPGSPTPTSSPSPGGPVTPTPGTTAYNSSSNVFYSAAFSPTNMNKPLSGGSPVWTTAWSPDGQLMATAFNGGYGNIVQVWNTNNGHLVTTYRSHSDFVVALSWSPDGKYVASASYDKTVQVWEASTGRTVTVYHGHASSRSFVTDVQWSPDGKTIASSAQDVEVWNPMTGRTLVKYNGTAGGVNSLAWSPDGTRIASSGQGSNTIQLWNASTGATLYTYTKNPRPVRTLAWSPDGKYIVSAGGVEETGHITVQVWIAS